MEYEFKEAFETLKKLNERVESNDPLFPSSVTYLIHVSSLAISLIEVIYDILENFKTDSASVQYDRFKVFDELYSQLISSYEIFARVKASPSFEVGPLLDLSYRLEVSGIDRPLLKDALKAYMRFLKRYNKEEP